MGDVIPVIFRSDPDPDGTITCLCGEVFTGADFQVRWEQYLTHIDNEHPS